MDNNLSVEDSNRQGRFDHRGTLERLAENYSHINGWGIDADPSNEPTHPMKLYTGADHDRLNYERPPQQPLTVEILHSNERPGVSAVFGAVNPPSGVSGNIRRWAFQYSEESLRHWFALVLADRINMLEGLVADIRDGHLPNVFAEMGWKAKWKYNRKDIVKKSAVTILVTTGVVLYLLARKKKK